MRLFIEQQFAINEIITLEPESSHYVQHVLRRKAGDTIFLFNGLKPLGEYRAVIISLTKKAVQCEILNFLDKNIESPVAISLFQGISKAERMDITIQKTVELGVSAIYPIWLERSNVKLNDPKRLAKKVQHWQKIAHSAMEQSGRTANVIVHSPIRLEQLSSYLVADLNLVLDPLSSNTIKSLSADITPENINILVGPEGGLSPQEIEFLKHKGFNTIQLGPRILRTETAGLAMLSVLQSHWGDF